MRPVRVLDPEAGVLEVRMEDLQAVRAEGAGLQVPAAAADEDPEACRTRLSAWADGRAWFGPLRGVQRAYPAEQ